MTFHPLATQAILQLAYFPINHSRVGSLKRPLSRWLTTRLSHNYRQARKNGYIHEEGYHISLKVILDERGLPHEARMRANVEAVREVLSEMKERRILSEMLPFHEKLVHAPSRGRPKIVDAVWTLYPSSEFVNDIVNGNRKMSSAGTKAGGNEGESYPKLGGKRGETLDSGRRNMLSHCVLGTKSSLLSPSLIPFNQSCTPE